MVIALVAPVGTDLGGFTERLDRSLRRFGYSSHRVRLSALTANFDAERKEVAGTPAYVRLNRLMHAGNFLRYTSERGEFLALVAAMAIRATRSRGSFRPKTAHILRSLKHPDEVRALRRIYGAGLYLVGITAEEEERRRYLRDHQGCTPEEVDALLKRDEHEEDDHYIRPDGQNYGQRTRDTFQLADAFVSLDAPEQLDRLLDLVFGCPFKTPSRDEHAMFLAFSAGLRSADLSRQVGAVLLSEQGDVIGIGANDVPAPGGGLYWPGPDDQRDYRLGRDSNEAQRDRIVSDVLERLRPDDVDATAWAERGKRKLRGSTLMDITEYGRAAHAEMEALLSCARTGTATRGATLYSTTFPCHNCAKHIIAAGVRRVVYVEPYPKSQATHLFNDSIVLGKNERGSGRVVFEPFVGIGPRRFFDLFSMGLSSERLRRKRDSRPVDWAPAKAVVRTPPLPNCYLDREYVAEQELLALTDRPRES